MNAHSNDMTTSAMPDLDSLLAAQKAAFAADRMPSREVRLDRLDRLQNLLLDNRQALADAISADFCGRSPVETDLAEIIPLLEGIKYYRKRLKKLMKPEKRHASLTVMPARAEVRYQPKGVVGIVVPWNFPVFLALSPLIGVLAAGNRAMLKMSEFTPRTGELLGGLLAEKFSDDEVVLVNGDVEVATAFTKLPFDHLVFTGSTAVGRKVMAAAAENLVPVTLELGGKSPAIIHPDFPMEEAAKRIAFGKVINAGQICIAPDYILCPRSQVDAFADAFANEVRENYPTYRDNPDYTAIITEAQRDRLTDWLADAEAKGARLMRVNPADEDLSGTRKLPVTIALDVSDDMTIMQDEIFGPILPIVPYDTLDEALAYVNERERPLALYYFDWDKSRADRVLARTHSGGACINDTLSHVTCDDLPFGGIGPSGIGHYHGEEGYRTFSHAKAVVRKGRIHATSLISPPWDGGMVKRLLSFQFKRFKRR
ncbi:coniferyl aldehyde dehydrogenase [Aurantiacibacter gangjinensis]|uniref:Aldehyde dehydrogenase n=1 Tax=Aurantiacibacter gangjinensis TaxID=502682 RepID=A0A0G9MT93_9SPHN|nr:coniferyl aldehyde dehydrogenase [Aurantiacibacter gangjinensis]APE28297.1 Aldehyde dehydrogenase; Probable coniferyl aldehyde dehydrogenase [Aurantiacibacter gangjinensis]KLE32538.1 coniferyl aldehyde dehydrogenase [Aurantiacibacter gangjinensis]